MTRLSAPLLLAAALAMTVAFPGSGFAQDATPAQVPSGPGCVPNDTDGNCLPTAPESDRIDLAEPEFSDSTRITNPLFPISELTQVIQLGTDAGDSLRVEATLLPETKIVEWNGGQIETVVSQFIAYLDGRVVEVANDFTPRRMMARSGISEKTSSTTKMASSPIPTAPGLPARTDLLA